MLAALRIQPRQTDAATSSGAKHTLAEKQASSPNHLLPSENNTLVNSAPSPGLPRTLSVDGEEYHSGALKGRYSSKQMAYLISAGAPDENKPVTHHPDGSKEYGFSHNEDKNCMARLYADKEKSVTALAIKDGRGKEIVNARYDKNLSVNGTPGRLNFNRPAVTIPPGAIFNGGELPYHPDGERYQVMPFRDPGSENPLMVTGLRHPSGNHFTVYDSSRHQPVTQLSVVSSRDNNGPGKEVVVSPEQARLPGGMRHFTPTAAGVKTSQSSPSGFKRKSDNQPCDRHGNLLSGPSSSQAAASSASAAGSSRMTVESIIAKGADPADRTESTGFRSIEQLRKYVRDNPVPRLVYRAHDADAEEIKYNGLERNFLSDKKEGDDYLADIIRHTAATGGSGGTVLSLSGEVAVANRFLHEGRSLAKIDTQQLPPGRFKSAAQILLEDGDRLLNSGKVNTAMVRKALENLLTEGEKEIFCLDGDIPPQAISVLR